MSKQKKLLYRNKCAYPLQHQQFQSSNQKVTIFWSKQYILELGVGAIMHEKSIVVLSIDLTQP